MRWERGFFDVGTGPLRGTPELNGRYKSGHRIRYYGLLTSQRRAKNIAHIRGLLAVPLIPIDDIKALNTKPEEPPEQPCPCCGGNMRIIETFQRGQQPKHRATPVAPTIRIDTS